MNIDRQIEFDKVKEIWADLAVTDQAKEKIRDTAFTEYFRDKRDSADCAERGLPDALSAGAGRKGAGCGKAFEGLSGERENVREFPGLL